MKEFVSKICAKIANNQWIKATAVRCLRTFVTSILGLWTAGRLITDMDWKFVLLSAASSTIYILLACIVADLPEVGDAIEDNEKE